MFFFLSWNIEYFFQTSNSPGCYLQTKQNVEIRNVNQSLLFYSIFRLILEIE